jgi:hypothetical protein
MVKVAFQTSSALESLKVLLEQPEPTSKIEEMHLESSQTDRWIKISFNSTFANLGFTGAAPALVTNLQLKKFNFNRLPVSALDVISLPSLRHVRLDDCLFAKSTLGLFRGVSSFAYIHYEHSIDGLNTQMLEEFFCSMSGLQSIVLSISCKRDIDWDMVLKLHPTLRTFHLRTGNKEESVDMLQKVRSYCPGIDSLGLYLGTISDAHRTGRFTEQFEAQIGQVATELSEWSALKDLHIYAFYIEEAENLGFCKCPKSVGRYEAIARRMDEMLRQQNTTTGLQAIHFVQLFRNCVPGYREIKRKPIVEKLRRSWSWVWDEEDSGSVQ